ncbi:hypothetical protein BCR34DRAFT_591847 [Clohesyomyces aquaticus]|uniref:2EXR domain-containing protein n=1 Tax=Clohesyomyces aquaticus TaxID=1231657 RepID=A0A1Y1YXL6_9PLEO|nr:hypothetical protein BCR34DRAFT_591847 [Clohesyomyces aquaticus]
MTTTPQHLQIINPSFRNDEHDTFHHFPRLPPELRLRIWELSVQKHRLLEAQITSKFHDTKNPPYSTLDELFSDRKYIILVRGIQLHSKLLRVSRESRKEALRFYRVHIPCYLHKARSVRGYKRSILYFNPEYDYMHVILNGSTSHDFIDLIHDLKSQDPRGVGFINVALGGSSDTHRIALSYLSMTSTFNSPARATFIDFLTSLKNILWMAQSPAGRIMQGRYIHPRCPTYAFNHSMPVKASSPSFSLLEKDSRPISSDLKHILTHSPDPREIRAVWRDILKNWGVRREMPVRERVLFAFDPFSYEGEDIYDFKSAEKFLEEEQEEWVENQRFAHEFEPANAITTESAKPLPTEGEAAVRPAIGFWLFPAEALGETENGNGQSPSGKRVFDMTGHWPEIALAHLF